MLSKQERVAIERRLGKLKGVPEDAAMGLLQILVSYRELEAALDESNRRAASAEAAMDEVEHARGCDKLIFHRRPCSDNCPRAEFAAHRATYTEPLEETDDQL